MPAHHFFRNDTVGSVSGFLNVVDSLPVPPLVAEMLANNHVRGLEAGCQRERELELTTGKLRAELTAMTRQRDLLSARLCGHDATPFAAMRMAIQSQLLPSAIQSDYIAARATETSACLFSGKRLVPNSDVMQPPMKVLTMVCSLCGQRRGVNRNKCQYCSMCCDNIMCTVRSHRQRLRKVQLAEGDHL